MSKNTTPNEFCSALRLGAETNGKPTLQVDYEKYEQLLEDADLTETQKREFITALWSIIVEFASLGFGVHPMQQIYQGDDCNDSISADETSRDELKYHLTEDLEAMLELANPKNKKTVSDAEVDTSLSQRESEAE